MYLYNVTVNVDSDIEKEWLHWMKTIHIPNVLETGFFIENKIFRLLHEPHNEGSTYSVQYFIHSLDDLEKYFNDFAPSLIAEHNTRYKDKHVAFRTVMEFVH